MSGPFNIPILKSFWWRQMRNKLVMKQLLVHWSLSIPIASTLLWGLDITWRLGFSDRWQRIIFHFVIKLTLRGAGKSFLLESRWFHISLLLTRKSISFLIFKIENMPFLLSEPTLQNAKILSISFYLCFWVCLVCFNQCWFDGVWGLVRNKKRGLLKIFQ